MSDDKLHPVYLPFTGAELLPHFAPITGSKADPERHLKYYLDSLQRLVDFEAAPDPAPGQYWSAVRYARQHEKDERFWLLAALLGVFYPEEGRVDRFSDLLSAALGSASVVGVQNWRDCLEGRLELFFEVNLPAPSSYRDWLKDHVDERAVIPHLREAAVAPRVRLEGQTKVDAMLIAKDTGFAVFFEGKVLSDAAYRIAFDAMRNQLARNIDIMLDSHGDSGLYESLRKRDPDRSCFVMVTPQLFRHNPSSRLYGWLYEHYKKEPQRLEEHLQHRDDVTDWHAVSKRLGWLTFEECNEIAPGSCGWLTTQTSNMA